MAFNQNTGEFRSGVVNANPGFYYWIIKLDGVDKNLEQYEEAKEFTRIEYAYYLMAKEAGIEMSESHLYREGNRYHFMSKRFDRIIDEKGNVHKLHMQTLASLFHLDYNLPGSFSYEETVQVMKGIGLSQKK